jgi:hypothetical protein
MGRSCNPLLGVPLHGTVAVLLAQKIIVIDERLRANIFSKRQRRKC